MSFPSSPCQIVAKPGCFVKETNLTLSRGTKIQGERSFGSMNCWLSLRISFVLLPPVCSWALPVGTATKITHRSPATFAVVLMVTSFLGQASLRLVEMRFILRIAKYSDAHYLYSRSVSDERRQRADLAGNSGQTEIPA